jgi:multiple sugar transport system substrate-binding protein
LTHNYFRHKINLATQSLDIQFPGCPSNDWRKAVKISTKWGSAAATALSLGLLVSGLPWGLTAASAADPITINFWHAYSEGGGETNAITNLLIPRFEAEHPGIIVKQAAIPYDSLHQKLLVAAAGGDLPDVVRADLAWVPELANIGVLAPLSTEMSDFKKYSSLVYPGPLATNYFKGKYYGLPLDTNTRVMFWNKAVFAKAGIKKAPATFADLLKDAPKLKKIGVKAFADGSYGGWTYEPWIWSGGGDLTDPKFTKASGYINSKKTIAVVTMLVDMYKKGYISDSITNNKSAIGTGDGLAKGKYGTIFDGPWFIPGEAGQYPTFKLTTSLIPAGLGGSVSVVGGEDVVMMSTTKQKAASLEFIRYMLSSDWQLTMAKVGQMPVREDTSALLPSIQPYYAIFAKQLMTAKTRIPSANFQKIDQIFDDQMQKALTGKMSPKAAMDAAAKAIDPLLAG